MGKEVITFDDIEVEKHKFHQCKSPILAYDVDVNKIVVSNKFPFGEKGFRYFIGYKVGKKVRPLCIMPSKTSTYRRDFEGTKYVFFDKK